MMCFMNDWKLRNQRIMFCFRRNLGQVYCSCANIKVLIGGEGLCNDGWDWLLLLLISVYRSYIRACRLIQAAPLPEMLLWVSTIPDRNIFVAEPVTIRVSASDPEGDNIAYPLSGAPVATRIDPTSGMFYWRPVLADSGVKATWRKQQLFHVFIAIGYPFRIFNQRQTDSLPGDAGNAEFRMREEHGDYPR